MPAPVVRVSATAPEREPLRQAATLLRAGRLVAFPTETVYGLGASALDAAAVQRIYDAKGRPAINPIIVHVASIEEARRLARDWTPAAETLARKFWPGPLTMIVKASRRLPLKVTANTGNVALRVPAAEIPLSVIRAAGVPITATSANISGEKECTTAKGVQEQLGNRIPIIVDGGVSPRTVASTIVDLTDADGRWSVQREGAITRQELEHILGKE